VRHDVDVIDVDAFAREWIAAWNAHDLERVLSHYSPEVELSSPIAAERVPGSGGYIRGEAELRAYWEPALAANPDLHFALEAVLTAVDGCTILYRNQRGQLVAESVFWNDAGLVTRAAVAYGPTAG
jgi:ketosteroid isomerase-like protein